jgi:histidinol-phosphate/aromatic aminotransferase/cobyric acid decarboxylase-like protein
LAGYELPNHLRVSVGTAAENDRFLDALANLRAADTLPGAL